MSKTAMKLALEALEPDWELAEWYVDELREKAITALREALAEQKSGIKQVIELYDSPDQPAQRKPLTDDELQLIANKFRANTNTGHSFYAIARAIEAAHGIKGDA